MNNQNLSPVPSKRYLKLIAQQIKGGLQDENVKYVTTITGNMVVGEFGQMLSTPDAYTGLNLDKSKIGYQREKNETRIKKMTAILRSVVTKNIGIPGSVLLSARKDKEKEQEELQFEPFSSLKNDQTDGTKQQVQMGYLFIPRSRLPLCEVDGQHRLQALRDAVNHPDGPGAALTHSYTAEIFELDLKKEAEVFIEINENQKKVDPTLAKMVAYGHDIKINDNITWRATAALNLLQTQSVIKGSIIMPNTNVAEHLKKVRDGKIAFHWRPSTILNSLKMWFKAIEAMGTKMDTEAGQKEFLNFMNNFLEALEEVFPQSYKSPNSTLSNVTVMAGFLMMLKNWCGAEGASAFLKIPKNEIKEKLQRAAKKLQAFGGFKNKEAIWSKQGLFNNLSNYAIRQIAEAFGNEEVDLQTLF